MGITDKRKRQLLAETYHLYYSRNWTGEEIQSYGMGGPELNESSYINAELTRLYCVDHNMTYEEFNEKYNKFDFSTVVGIIVIIGIVVLVVCAMFNPW